MLREFPFRKLERSVFSNGESSVNIFDDKEVEVNASV